MLFNYSRSARPLQNGARKPSKAEVWGGGHGRRVAL